MDQHSALRKGRQLASSHLITSCAALAGLFIFVPVGQRIVAATFGGTSNSPVNGQLTVAFLLNIAVILFAWRRSKDLQAALAANHLAEQAAHDNAFTDHVTGLANRRELMRALADPGAKFMATSSSFSTSTISRRSTTFTVTWSATRCLGMSLIRLRANRPKDRAARGLAATNSPFSSRCTPMR